MGYPDHKTYAALYAKYIEGRDVGELAQLLQPLKGTQVLDLCCGEGLATRCVLGMNAERVVAVDAEPLMIPAWLSKYPNVRICKTSVVDAFDILHNLGLSFDRAVCRQAINYWLNRQTAGRIADALEPGGIFAFNTFNQQPTLKPRIKEYELGGHAFAEVSWLVGDTVHHVQVREGMVPHCTSFRWISPEQFREILEPYFHIEEHRRGKTSLYKCVKR